MNKPWLPITYRDFYDLPRTIMVFWEGKWYFLDCPFDDTADDYSDMYTVYRLPSSCKVPAAEADWTSLPSVGELVGDIPVARVQFDESRRGFVAGTMFELI